MLTAFILTRRLGFFNFSNPVQCSQHKKATGVESVTILHTYVVQENLPPFYSLEKVHSIGLEIINNSSLKDFLKAISYFKSTTFFPFVRNFRFY